MPFSLDVVFDFMSIEPSKVWALLVESHPSLLAAHAECEFDDGHYSVADVPRRIQARSVDRPHFNVKMSNGELFYGHIRNQRQSLIWIRELVVDLADADQWVFPFLAEEGFVQAWVYDAEYNKWQNAEDPLTYEAEGIPCEHLPRRSNGLPFPLEKEVIDTSQNPGRRQIRMGYVEAVGAVMWLSNRFAKRVGLNLRELSFVQWLSTQQVSKSVLRVQVADHPFACDHNNERSLQERLRSILFPSADVLAEG